jgi:GNAT superfamily N-acetyltransferase
MNDWLETEGESAKITSSISEAEGNGESVITFKDEQEEPIGYLSYHLNRINKSVNVNSVWTHPDRRREGIASQLLENLRAKYPKSDGWRLDVSWTTDDGTAWAEANDDSIDLGNYKTANSWDEEPNNNPQLIRLASSWDELDDSNQLWPLKESNWDEIENDLSQMPLTNSVCPKCKADAYKWFDKDESHPNDGTFLCPECQHLTGITDNNELFSYVPPGSVFENLVLNKYRMSSVPQKFGNSWSDQEPKGQAFMPLDEEWMERNRS